MVDADVISHFMATGYIDRLTEILQPHAVMIVENVYKEASGTGQETEGGQVDGALQGMQDCFPLCQ